MGVERRAAQQVLRPVGTGVWSANSLYVARPAHRGGRDHGVGVGVGVGSSVVVGSGAGVVDDVGEGVGVGSGVPGPTVK